MDLTNSPGTGRLFSRGDVIRTNYRLDIIDPLIEFRWSTGDTVDAKIKVTKSLA